MSEKTPATADIVYLGCPYTDRNREVREERFYRATVAAAHLIEQGLIVYSPITMTHPIDEVLAEDDAHGTLGSDYWVRFDEAFMEFCSRMIILKVDGWDRSRGIAREMDWFKRKGRPIEYLEWSEVGRLAGRVSAGKLSS